MDRLTVVEALDELVLREDGLGFQRLARRLLKFEFPDLIAHAEKADQGRDASFTRAGQRGILLASLTATWAKVSRDLARARTAGPDFQFAIFCTARSVTNERIMRWRERAAEEGVELEVRERAWVTDECLHPRNAVIAVHELRIAPEQAQKGRAEALLASEPFTVSPKPISIGRTSVAMHNGGGVVAWSEAPLDWNSERIMLAFCEPEGVEGNFLGEGADAQCASLANDLYVCWTRLHEDVPLHTLRIWQQSTQQVVEITAVEELIAPPHLAMWDNEPAVVYLAGGRAKPLSVSALAIATGAESHLEVASPGVLLQESAAIDELIDNRRVETPAFSVRVGGLSVAHGRGPAVALIYGVFSAHLFVLTDRWRPVEAPWPFGGDIHSAELAVAGGRVHCLTQSRGGGIYSGVADLGGRGWSDAVLLTGHGWHPECVQSSGRRFGAWVGSPPLPLGAQHDAFAAGSAQRWIDEMGEIAEELRARDLYRRSEPDPQLTAFGGFQDVSPMAPLWVGVLDERGHCVGESANLGFFGRAARWPKIAVDGDGRGLLMWECGDGDEAWLLARWLQA